MTHPRTFVLCAAVISLAVGCNSSSEPTDESTSGGEEGPASTQRRVDLTPAHPVDGAERCSLRTVYFAYDSAELDGPSRDAIEAAVTCLRGRGAPARLRLTGASDPRGTEEYNIALGERRADTVRRFLTSMGVDAGRIAVHSVGEETAEGTDEEGWRRDRHVSSSAED